MTYKEKMKFLESYKYATWIEKGYKIIDSCRTEEHFDVTFNYILRITKYLADNNIHSMKYKNLLKYYGDIYNILINQKQIEHDLKIEEKIKELNRQSTLIVQRQQSFFKRKKNKRKFKLQYMRIKKWYMLA